MLAYFLLGHGVEVLIKHGVLSFSRLCRDTVLVRLKIFIILGDKFCQNIVPDFIRIGQVF